MLTKNELKSSIQTECVSKLEVELFYGYAIISMGVGKTKIIVDAIKRFMELGMYEAVKDRKYPIVILVNSRYLRDVETPKECLKWGLDLKKEKIKIACYQTAYKWKNTDVGFMIADEMDYALSESGAYAKVFNLPHDFFLGLSGTMIPDKAQKSFQLFSRKPFMEFTIKDAQKLGLLNQTYIWVHEVPLSLDMFPKETKKGTIMTNEVREYKYIQWQIDNYRNEIRQGYIMKDQAFQSGEDTAQYDAMINRAIHMKAYWEYNAKNPICRVSFLKGLQSLTDYAVRLKHNILNTDPNNKVILFTQLTSSADLLSPYRYHGKEDDITIIDSFNEGDINELAVVKKVHRGVNFKGLNNAIIHSFNTSMTDALQAYFGRMVRLESDDVAHIHFLISTYQRDDGYTVHCQNGSWCDQIILDTNVIHMPRVIKQFNI